MIKKTRLTVEEFHNALNDQWNSSIARREQRIYYTPSTPLRERDYSIPGMGLMGEAGEAGEHFKKQIRDGTPVRRKRKAALELGDTLHYLCRCIYLAGYTLEEICKLNQQKIARRRKRGVKHA